MSKCVCADCVDDYAIKNFICSVAESHTCSYCGRQEEVEEGEPIAASFDEMKEFVREAVELAYEDPVHSVGYCSEEGGYLLETMDSWDLMEDVGLDNSNQKFLEDLTDEFTENEWVKKDPYGPWEDEALQYSWDRFSEQVKHEKRFVFFKMAGDPNSSYPDPEPYEILNDLGEIVTKIDLITLIPEGTEIIRARQHNGTLLPCNAADLGSPPKDCARQSRMSPAGIPMFYGATAEKTAFEETYSADPEIPHVTFATFKTLRALRLLDLTTIPKVPSFFDTESAHVRMSLSFMHNFEADATQPIPNDHSVHYRYVPTQVVAEYFRSVFKMPDGGPIDGILFDSSKTPSGKCYTLFANCKHCTDDASDLSKILALVAYRKSNIDFSTNKYS